MQYNQAACIPILTKLIRKTLQMHGFPIQIYEEVSYITLTLKCESKFPKVKSLISTHSACLYKNRGTVNLEIFVVKIFS